VRLTTFNRKGVFVRKIILLSAVTLLVGTVLLSCGVAVAGVPGVGSNVAGCVAWPGPGKIGWYVLEALLIILTICVPPT